MKRIFFYHFLFLLFLGAFSLAQTTNTVTFQADISELLTQGFTPGENTLTVEGLNWDDPGISVSGDRNMTQDPNNSNTYVTILTIVSDGTVVIGDSIRWKFKGGPDSDFVNGGWESGDPISGFDGRAYYLQANGNAVVLDPIIPRLEMIQVNSALQNTVTFQADLSLIYGSGIGFFDPTRGDILEVKGFWGNSSDTSIVDGFLVSGDPLLQNLDPFNPSLYTTTITIAIPEGSVPGMGTGFKFKAGPDDHFSNTGWEVTPNRDYIFGENNAVVVLDPIQPSISPAAGPLANDLTVLYQINLTDGSANRFDNSIIPLDQVEFAVLKGAADVLGGWQGSWTLQDTALAVILNDSGENGDKVTNDNIWSALVTFAAGTPQGLSPYKYGVYYPGCENVSGAGTAYLDNSAPSGQDLSFYIHESTSTLEVLNVWPTVISSVELIDNEIPVSYSLSQNYPNPFNPETRIRYTIKEAGNVKMDIYNTLGEHVANILNTNLVSATYELSFTPNDLPSGIYFYTLTTENFRSTKKMIYIK